MKVNLNDAFFQALVEAAGIKFHAHNLSCPLWEQLDRSRLTIFDESVK